MPKPRPKKEPLIEQAPPATEGLHATLERCEAIFQQVLAQIDPNRIKVETPNDLYKVGNALSGLARAKIDLWKAQREQNEHFDAALRWWGEAFYAMFGQTNPEMYEQIVATLRDMDERRKITGVDDFHDFSKGPNLLE